MAVEAVIATQVIDTTSVGRSVMTAANAAAALSAIGAQASLVSGTNIKTINSTSLLGEGDIAVSASPAGSSGQVQYNNAGAFGGMTAVVYAATGTHVAITSQAATTVPLCIKGAASQSAPLTEWRNSANALRASINDGLFYTKDGGGLDSLGSFNGCGIRINGDRVCLGGYGGGEMVQWFGGNPGELRLSAYGTPLVMGTGPVRGTAASGTNAAGGALKLSPGLSTGNATPATVTIQRTTAVASGTTAQTPSDALSVDGSTTAGETPILLLDISKGTLQRVSIGASDSGGAGFKVLRVPN